MIYEYFYNICGIRWRVCLPFPLRIEIESEAFMETGGVIHEINDSILGCETDRMTEIPQENMYLNSNYYSRQKGISVVQRAGRQRCPYAEAWFTPEQVSVKFLPDAQKHMQSTLQFLNFIGLEQLLLRHDALILHASFIRFRDMGILFSAPSGTGKSTQADLWARYMNSETLNGDRAGLRRIDGVWTAFGLPYAGSSNIYRNESAPIRAIVALAQGKENHIRQLSAMEAVRKLLPEFSLHRWDEIYMNHALNLIIPLLSQVPVYLLTCRPDEDAVRLLAETLECNNTTKED